MCMLEVMYMNLYTCKFTVCNYAYVYNIHPFLTSASISFSFWSFSCTFISNTSSISTSILCIFISCSLFSTSNWANGSLQVRQKKKTNDRGWMNYVEHFILVIHYMLKFVNQFKWLFPSPPSLFLSQEGRKLISVPPVFPSYMYMYM